MECLRSCNCTAYASANISEGGSGCIAWHGDLVDTRIFTAGGQDFYLRVDELELAQYAKKSKGSVATKRIRITMVILGVIIFFTITFIAYWFVKRKRKGHRKLLSNANITSQATIPAEKLEESKPRPDLPFFDITTLITATDNFALGICLDKVDLVPSISGYMAPEYAMQGLYSTKSDIFSFGVLQLEIISSRKNTECINGSQFPNLIGHVWELWNDGRVLDVVDPALCQPFSTDEYADSSKSSGAVSWNRVSITALEAR
ncbi:hypothetical protein FNV43_RR01392 [Rhamnella rubrinervis]|uniref:Apple domain-containing protein n=1 Tax=Rhamnella rubrinervis TaxID=2594499 RepID=A0A8K0HRD8_9ROSA|nr:hypothetical protein FNV43_RR01392 [Rhamnella rubrinervis]